MFNHPVRPAGVRGRLKVSRNDKSLSVNIISTSHDQPPGLIFAQDVRPEAPITIEITPSLRPAAGTKATTAPARDLGRCVRLKHAGSAQADRAATRRPTLRP